MTELERAIRELTRPINGQYPRPWMTDIGDPEAAEVFIVGKNQAKAYDAARLGSHDRHLNALFNRNGESCKAMYLEMADKLSKTRPNIESLTRRLQQHGVSKVLETNVICYSSPMSADLRLPAHAGGMKQGEEIFRTLLAHIKPRVLIAHGAGTLSKLETVLGQPVGRPPESPGEVRKVRVQGMTIFPIPSLAPPGYNKWARWAPAYLENVASAVAQELRDR
jgi:hypothetical protein